MDKFLKGLLCILGAVFCWSTLEVTASHIFAEGAGPITMLNLRFLIATILFGGTILYKNKKTGKTKTSKMISILFFYCSFIFHDVEAFGGIFWPDSFVFVCFFRFRDVCFS